MDYPKDVEYARSLSQVTELEEKGAESQVADLTSSNAWKVFVQISFSAQKVKFVGVLQNCSFHTHYRKLTYFFPKVTKKKKRKRKFGSEI